MFKSLEHRTEKVAIGKSASGRSFIHANKVLRDERCSLTHAMAVYVLLFNRTHSSCSDPDWANLAIIPVTHMRI